MKLKPETKLCLTLTYSEWQDVIETFETWGDAMLPKRHDRRVYVRVIANSLKAQIKHAESTP